MRDRTKRKLRITRETLLKLDKSDLDQVAGGAVKRPWTTAWTCRSCPDVSCACDA